jgi:quercetin dioxygenase-like cupin family protein
MNRRERLECSKYVWDKVRLIEYKSMAESATFRNVKRQNIVSAADGVSFEVRYFECGKEGFTTLEKHRHTHIVFILRGSGKVIVDKNVYDAKPFDCFIISEWKPHQFINTSDNPFGFLCMVSCERDKYQLLSKEEVKDLRTNRQVDECVRIPNRYFSES